ncbi:type II toxin-antitoxin system PemK/MazF family toxin [Yunchengibacter salinarum]|uniref:type II toxin-antitoxin system PemK/MazF family toxin n=1 Tax=Yunchengibacter salinarum TaxID=3133399 RepID=UPI0035B58171
MVDETSPQRVIPTVKSAPRIRQVYWCTLPNDAQLPEFSKIRPVLIMSLKTHLYGKVTVLPFSTKSQPDNPHAYSIQSPLEAKPAWVICDHLMTVAVSRLSPPGRTIPRISQEDFEHIKQLALKNLPYSFY